MARIRDSRVNAVGFARVSCEFFNRAAALLAAAMYCCFYGAGTEPMSTFYCAVLDWCLAFARRRCWCYGKSGHSSKHIKVREIMHYFTLSCAAVLFSCCGVRRQRWCCSLLQQPNQGVLFFCGYLPCYVASRTDTQSQALLLFCFFDGQRYLTPMACRVLAPPPPP